MVCLSDIDPSQDKKDKEHNNDMVGNIEENIVQEEPSLPSLTPFPVIAPDSTHSFLESSSEIFVSASCAQPASIPSLSTDIPDILLSEKNKRARKRPHSPSIPAVPVKMSSRLAKKRQNKYE